MKTFLFIFFALIIGFLGGRTSVTPEKIHPEIQEKPQSLCKEKPIDKNTCLLEAKEFYGKAFILFLTNIGHKLSGASRSQLQSLLNDPENFVENPLPKIEKVESTDNNVASEEIEMNDNDEYLPTSFDHPDKTEKDTTHIENKKLIQRAKKFQLKSPSVYKAKSTYVDKFSKIKKINGSFYGKIYIVSGPQKGETHRVEMNVDFIRKDEDKIDGTFHLNLLRFEEAYSTSNGSGGNGDIRYKNGTVMIEAGPNRFFHFKNAKLTLANFYVNGKHIGIAQFTKK